MIPKSESLWPKSGFVKSMAEVSPWVLDTSKTQVGNKSHPPHPNTHKKLFLDSDIGLI